MVSMRNECVRALLLHVAAEACPSWPHSFSMNSQGTLGPPSFWFRQLRHQGNSFSIARLTLTTLTGEVLPSLKVTESVPEQGWWPGGGHSHDAAGSGVCRFWLEKGCFKKGSTRLLRMQTRSIATVRKQCKLKRSRAARSGH